MRVVMRFMNFAAAFLVVGVGSAQAQFVPTQAFIDPGFTGNTQHDLWSSLTVAANPGFPGFPGTTPWSGLGSATPNVGGDGDAELNKLSNESGGGPYPASASIYFFGQGTLGVSDSTPVADLATIAFQISIGEAGTVDFVGDVLPVLNFNGGTQALAAGSVQLLEAYDNGIFTPPEGDPSTIYINTYLLMWDVTALGAISEFEITFTGEAHSQVYGLQLDQSDVAAVPEPGTWALAAALLGGCLLYRRRLSAPASKSTTAA